MVPNSLKQTLWTLLVFSIKMQDKLEVTPMELNYSVELGIGPWKRFPFVKRESPEKCHNLKISYLCLSWSVLLGRVFTCAVACGVAKVKMMVLN